MKSCHNTRRDRGSLPAIAVTEGAVIIQPLKGEGPWTVEEWRRWLADREERGTPGTFRLGFVAPQVAAALEGRNIGLQAAAITISKPRVGHIRRAVKGQRGARLDDADFDRLPAIIARPRAVLLDTAQGGNCLIYVFDPLAPQGGMG